jgi:hypothetical protein
MLLEVMRMDELTESVREEDKGPGRVVFRD